MTSPVPTLKAVEPLTAPITILAIAAHHDDLEFGIAGSVARWVKEGAKVIYVIVTDGGAGSNTPGVIRSELSELRKQEQQAASAVVGVSDTRFLGYPDGVLQPTLDLRRDLTRIIRETKPDRVITNDPTMIYFGDGYINHPDHRAAGEAALYAVFPSSETRPIFPELLEEGFEPHHVRELWLNFSTSPTHFVDITDTMEQKLDSLRCHVSQIGEGEAAENGALKWVREGIQDMGDATGGVKHAEFYKVMNFDREPPQTKVEEAVAAGETIEAQA
jgi:LmbE family N-acetylglucosaminyl deacetylase